MMFPNYYHELELKFDYKYNYRTKKRAYTFIKSNISVKESCISVSLLLYFPFRPIAEKKKRFSENVCYFLHILYIACHLLSFSIVL